MRFDGWVALPAAFCRQLGLATGAELEAELVAGAVVLRPQVGAKRAGAASRETQPAAAPEAEADVAVTPGPGASAPEPAVATASTAAPAEAVKPPGASRAGRPRRRMRLHRPRTTRPRPPAGRSSRWPWRRCGARAAARPAECRPHDRLRRREHATATPRKLPVSPCRAHQGRVSFLPARPVGAG